jgi:exopolysaccharide biosynthesis polyprenyl glycosylphosphotransferase
MGILKSEVPRSKNISIALLVVADFAIIYLALLLAQWFRFGSGLFGVTSVLSTGNAIFLLAISASWLAALAAYGLYQERNFFPVLEQLFRVLKAVVVGTIVLLVMVFLLKANARLQSRLFIGFGFLASLGFLFVWRGLLFSKLICRLLGQWGIGRKALIVGAGERGCHLAQYIAERPSLGLDVVGFIDDKMALKDTKVSDLAVLGTTSDIAEVVQKFDVGEIFLGIPSLSHAELLTLIDKCKATQLPVTLTSELLDVVSQHSPLGKIDGIPAITIQPNRFSEVGQIVKRCIDLAFSGLVLLLTAPMLVLAGVLIKLSSPGPVFFKQTRLGRGGRPFTMYKLRTMVRDQDDDIHRQYLKDFISTNTTIGKNEKGENQFKMGNDPRVTKVGKFLRRLSLDELPQLINVIRGEMSLVGPRPPISYEVELYKDWHTKRLQVKPGITGLWQVAARSAVGFDDMVMLDLYYIEHWSLLFDFQLLLKTIPAVFSGKGAL